VERLTKADRACAVAAAAAHDLNDELTVIVNSVSCSLRALDFDHPARSLLLQAQSAAQRCVWKTSGMLNYAVRRGAQPANVPMERLVLEADEPALRYY
jgi:hypothetical protein